MQLPTDGRATCRIGMCEQRKCFQLGGRTVGPFAFRYQGNGATPWQHIDTTRKAIDCPTTLPFLYNETLQQTFRPLLLKLSKR